MSRSSKDMHFMASVQPMTQDSLQKGYKGTYMTRARKLQLVNNFLKDGGKPIPLCIDHASADDADAQLSEDETIGYTTGMFLDPEGTLMITGYILGSHPSAERVFRGIQLEGEAWGVSGFTRFMWELEDDKAPDDSTKTFTHIGVTMNPDMAEEGSWIHCYGYGDAGIMRVMREEMIPAGAIANERSLAAWKVPVPVVKSILSVLAHNIIEASSTGEIIPTAIDRKTMASMQPTTPAGSAPAPAQQQLSQQPPAQPTGQQQSASSSSAPAPDAMEQDHGSDGPSSEQISNAILAAFREAKAKVDAMTDDFEKMYSTKSLIDQVSAQLKANGIALQDAPDEMQELYLRSRNEVRALDEKIQTMIIEEGTAGNNKNAALVQEYRNPQTAVPRKKEICTFVKASRDGKQHTQKIFEAQLQEERKQRAALEEKLRAHENELSTKRKRDEEFEALKKENEALKKRRGDLGGMRGSSAPGGVSFSFNVGGDTFAAAEQAEMPSSYTPSSASTASYSSAPSPAPSGPGAMDVAMPPEGTPLGFKKIMPGAPGAQRKQPDLLVVNGAESQRQPSFVTATGFQRVAEDQRLGARVAHEWAQKFIVPPHMTAFGRHGREPVFQTNFNILRGITGESGFAYVPADKEGKTPLQSIEFNI